MVSAVPGVETPASKLGVPESGVALPPSGPVVLASAEFTDPESERARSPESGVVSLELC
jgi:hypothetical protein